MILLVLMLSLTAKTAKAFEPLSIAGAFVSPIFCKMIGCKSSEYIFVGYPEENKKRLDEITKAFDWNNLALENVYKEGECTQFMTDIAINNKYAGNVCYINGKWEIQPDEEYCFNKPFTDGCAVQSIR